MNSGEILINIGLEESRVALIDGGLLQEIFIERKSNRGIVGNIYKGKVARVLPGMNAAFIDIGLQKNAFLHVNKISVKNTKDTGNNTKEDAQPEEKKISDFVRAGQDILVQVIKDPMGTKGARLTTDISIASRYVVFLPNSSDIGVSIRIENERLRKTLKEYMEKFSSGLEGGYIVRTAIENTSEWAMHSDIKYLQNLWQLIKNKESSAKIGECIYAGLPLHLSIIRDLIDDSISVIRVDNEAAYKEMGLFLKDFYPENSTILLHHKSNNPIFDLYSVDDEINKSLKRHVGLKSGGYLVIDETEAMTTIDVNTGKFTGTTNQEETIFKTNLEASKVIARQLRLRNIGGIIIVDFIDMLNKENKLLLMESLAKAMEGCGTRYSIEPLTGLGLVTMTRKRTRESLGHFLCEACPVCIGRGYIKTIETISHELLREITREATQFCPNKVIAVVNDEVNSYLTDEHPELLADLEEIIKVPITIKSDPYYEREYYDIAIN